MVQTSSLCNVHSYRAASGNFLHFWGLVIIIVFIGYATVQVATNFADERAVASVSAGARSIIHTAAPTSIYVIDGDTISLNDGRPNVRLVGFNAAETGSRARYERQKGETAKTATSRVRQQRPPRFPTGCLLLPAGDRGHQCLQLRSSLRHATSERRRRRIDLDRRGFGGSLYMRRHKLSKAAAPMVLTHEAEV